jgi:hypothetical protein
MNAFSDFRLIIKMVNKNKGWCWAYFRTETVMRSGKEVLNAYCKFCNTCYQNSAGRMIEHLKVFTLSKK